MSVTLKSYEGLLGNHLALRDLLPKYADKSGTDERRAFQRFRIAQFSEVVPLDPELRVVGDPFTVNVSEISEGGLSFVCSKHLIHKHMMIRIKVGTTTLSCIIEIMRKQFYGKYNFSQQFGCRFLLLSPT